MNRGNSHLTEKIFILFFCLLLSFVPISWIFLPQNQTSFSESENRFLNNFPTLDLGSLRRGINELLSGDFRTAYRSIFINGFSSEYFADLKAAASDQLPFRLPLATFARWVERKQINVIYGLLPDPAFPASLGQNYLILRGDKQVYIQPPASWDDARRELIDNRISNYQLIIDSYPEINFFVFYLERMAFSPYNPMNSFFPKADKGQSFDYFLSRKPDELTVAYLRLDGLEEHQQNFYRTDHHWNIRGAWAGYEIIYDMIKARVPELSPRLTLSEFVQIEGVEFCGSYARRTLYPCQPDIFEYADVDLPPFRTYMNGVESPRSNRNAYFRGEFNRNRYTEHYAEFFGYVTALVEYDFDNLSDRNLLIIGGSYTQAMQEFIAAHFDKTFIVDLREYEDFSLGKFINDHQIDDVIVIGDVIVYSREGWQINP